ncbi:efflux RND transporter periplasmic adaptor subunit [Ramlibacter rhizophilus]|uniref:Efflux RND transporter periplasmic adaptor subunit n=1 Tax=Ramlibacter rhizophilus TaxID=1781167 RepID=A0A4Z0BGK9_9BURK|nr:efflux RND transporter periplasmic adaptor subunit [Ramlibacter rhizophilus]TFY97881.1 efflux RND transporter periplasmic adaptor subunit [Ramlibacter rhizophilus]
MHASTLRTPLLLIALALVLAACQRNEGPDAASGSPAATAPEPKPALTVTTTTPLRAQLAQTLAANGNIAAWQEASIGAETGGQRLTEVRVNVGDRVKKGQVLAVFARDTVDAEAAQARATLAEAEAAAAEAVANAQRARSLEATGALSASQINQYVTAAETARARVQAARAALDARQLRQGQTQVVAPDEGIISARNATVGAVVASGTELFRLIRQGRLEWRAEVTSDALGRLRPGTPAEVTAASGARLQGRVRTIGPTVDPQTRQALVYVDVKPVGEGGNALPGMYARGSFDLGSASALTVPQTAVVVRDGFSYVMTLTPDNRVQQVKVQAGRIVGDRMEIIEGLAPDARVIASGGSFLNEGDVVRVVDPTPQPGVAAAAPDGAAPGNGAAAK